MATADARQAPDAKHLRASVVMPAFNAAATIGVQLDALLAQHPGFAWEIIVGDNGSTDDTRSVIDARDDAEIPITVVDASDRRGAAYARNRAAAAARADLILFCDADDIVSRSWVGAMVDALGEADVVSGPADVTRLNSPDVVQWRGEGRKDRLPGTVFLPAGFGANMGASRDAFEKIGGFSLEFTGAAGEDLDFFWRAQLAGFTAGFSRDATVHYRLRDDLRANARQAFFYGRSVPQLYSLHARHGMPRRPPERTLRQAAWVVIHAPDYFRGSARRGKWVWGACNLLGRVVGAFKFRVISI